MDRFHLSKPQKKVCRKLIKTTLQRECAEFIEKLSNNIDRNNENELSPYERYLDIFKRVKDFDKTLQWNYDNVSGSRYFMTVFNLCIRGVLNDEDLKTADDKMRNELIDLKNAFI